MTAHESSTEGTHYVLRAKICLFTIIKNKNDNKQDTKYKLSVIKVYKVLVKYFHGCSNHWLHKYKTITLNKPD